MITFLEGLNFSELMLIIVAILLLIQFIPSLIKNWEDLQQKMGWQKSSDIKEKEQGERIKKLEDKLNALELKVDRTAGDFLQNQQTFHGQSIKIRNELADSISKMAERQMELIQRVEELYEQSRKYQLTDMRETLLQAHRYYTGESTNPLKMWTEIEQHAWYEQYEVYVSAKGNSYVEDTVKPEMDALKIIYLNDYEGMQKLMASRSQCNK